MGTPTTIVGIQIHKTTSGHILHQEQFIERACKKYNIPHKHTYTPIPTAHKMDDQHQPQLTPEVREQYLSLIGTIRHAADNTRPDTTYSAHILATHITNPTQEHLQLATRTMQYLLTTKHWGLKYTTTTPTSEQNSIKIYTDASQTDLPEGRTTISNM
eukprot:Pgem_evm1s18399